MTQNFREKVIDAQRQLGWSNMELSRRAGVSYDVVRELHRRPNSTTSADNAAKLLDALGRDLPTETQSHMVPVYDVAASAGHGAEVVSEVVVDQLAFPAGYLRRITSAAPRDLAIIGVKGKSMEPTLSDDDVVMVDMSKRDLSFDGLFVLRDGGASLLVKRVSRGRRRGTVMLISDNPTYPPIERDVADVEVVGKVVWKGVKE